jgi:hypothetical protein
MVLVTEVLRRGRRAITESDVRIATLMSVMASPVALGLVALAAAVPPAGARGDDLWATVNVCDTPRQPHTIGLRASMPGTPRRAGLYMRFRVQYRDGDSWRHVARADSGWDRVGRARGGAVESGWSFELAPPAEPVTLRGVVRFRWRRDGRIVRRELAVTETGHRSTRGADPEDYSAATCSMA